MGIRVGVMKLAFKTAEKNKHKSLFIQTEEGWQGAVCSLCGASS
jgi:hypothetical protein